MKQGHLNTSLGGIVGCEIIPDTISFDPAIQFGANNGGYSAIVTCKTNPDERQPFSYHNLMNCRAVEGWMRYYQTQCLKDNRDCQSHYNTNFTITVQTSWRE